jgi:CheY-like chemotaxis protein
LVAEDNPVNQRVAVGALERLGCRVDVVGNGRDAVEMVSRFSYDVVFMDCIMPDMDGFEATRRIRDLESGGRRLPIIALTALAMAGDCERCLEAGMDDYISKPARLRDFEKVLRRWAQAAVIRDEAPSEPQVVLSEPLDPAVVEELRRLANHSEAFLEGLFGSFIEQATETIELLRQAARGSDSEAFARVVRSLKESSASVGAIPLAGVCQHMETLCGTGAFAEAGTLVDQLECEFGRVKRALVT